MFSCHFSFVTLGASCRIWPSFGRTTQTLSFSWCRFFFPQPVEVHCAGNGLYGKEHLQQQKNISKNLQAIKLKFISTKFQDGTCPLTMEHWHTVPQEAQTAQSLTRELLSQVLYCKLIAKHSIGSALAMEHPIWSSSI
ncbi:hypothetical protein ILYODFUR_008330 [Ilyodon furcidens]|uniref:Uncharacterized protein n=1 Tax=Ilyodon furcidens TaxID=33524 RepID=A0ABV0TH83_9TELE